MQCFPDSNNCLTSLPLTPDTRLHPTQHGVVSLQLCWPVLCEQLMHLWTDEQHQNKESDGWWRHTDKPAPAWLEACSDKHVLWLAGCEEDSGQCSSQLSGLVCKSVPRWQPFSVWRQVHQCNCSATRVWRQHPTLCVQAAFWDCKIQDCWWTLWYSSNAWTGYQASNSLPFSSSSAVCYVIPTDFCSWPPDLYIYQDMTNNVCQHMVCCSSHECADEHLMVLVENNNSRRWQHSAAVRMPWLWTSAWPVRYLM